MIQGKKKHQTAPASFQLNFHSTDFDSVDIALHLTCTRAKIRRSDLHTPNGQVCFLPSLFGEKPGECPHPGPSASPLYAWNPPQKGKVLPTGGCPVWQNGIELGGEKLVVLATHDRAHLPKSPGGPFRGRRRHARQVRGDSIQAVRGMRSRKQ